KSGLAPWAAWSVRRTRRPGRRTADRAPSRRPGGRAVDEAASGTTTVRYRVEVHLDQHRPGLEYRRPRYTPKALRAKGVFSEGRHDLKVRVRGDENTVGSGADGLIVVFGLVVHVVRGTGGTMPVEPPPYEPFFIDGALAPE